MFSSRIKSQISSNLLVTIFVLLCSVSASFSQEGVDNSENAYSLYNERGYLKSNSYTLDGNFVINDFNGNLMFVKSLRRIPTTQNGVTQDLKLAYNGSVSHIISSGLGTPSNVTIQSTVNSPEWIISFNGYALQTLNFENEVVSWLTSNSTAIGSDVALLVNGYHYCFSRTGTAEPQFTVLLEDGSVRSFMRVNTSDEVGGYLTMNKDDQTKAYYYLDSGFFYFKVYNIDGTTVTFKKYTPTWKTPSNNDG